MLSDASISWGIRIARSVWSAPGLPALLLADDPSSTSQRAPEPIAAASCTHSKRFAREVAFMRHYLLRFAV
jgi:hypothetical protein